MGKLRTFTATIASGATASDTIDLGDYTLVAIVTPASLTGTAFTFAAAATPGDTLAGVYDTTGTQYSVTVSTSRLIPLDPADWAGVRLVQVTSGSTEGGARSITLIGRDV